jgi:hypothetical protein
LGTLRNEISKSEGGFPGGIARLDGGESTLTRQEGAAMSAQDPQPTEHEKAPDDGDEHVSPEEGTPEVGDEDQNLGQTEHEAPEEDAGR